MNHHQSAENNSRETGKFEESLERLEKIVNAMEKGELTLEQTLQHYEEGMKLARFCAEKLGDAEKKIEVLSGKSTEGEDEWTALNIDLNEQE